MNYDEQIQQMSPQRQFIPSLGALQPSLAALQPSQQAPVPMVKSPVPGLAGNPYGISMEGMATLTGQKPPAQPAPNSIASMAGDYNRLQGSLPNPEAWSKSFVLGPPSDYDVQRLREMGAPWHAIPGILGAKVAGGRSEPIPMPRLGPSAAEQALALMHLQSQKEIAGMQYSPEAMDRKFRESLAQNEIAQGRSGNVARQNIESAMATLRPSKPNEPEPPPPSSNWDTMHVGDLVKANDMEGLTNVLGSIADKPGHIKSLAGYLSEQRPELGGAVGVMNKLGPEFARLATNYPDLLGSGVSVTPSDVRPHLSPIGMGSSILAPGSYTITTPAGQHKVMSGRLLENLPPFTAAGKDEERRRLTNLSKLMPELIARIKQQQK